MKRNLTLLFVTAVLLSFISCKDKASKFVGDWKNIVNEKEHVIVAKSGKEYTVEFHGKKETAEYDAEADKLTSFQSGITYELKVDEDSHDLLFNNKEFTKD